MSSAIKYLATFFILFFVCLFISNSPTYAVFTDTGGGDHEGADWIISTNTTIAGTHTNIGTFSIGVGVTATIQAYNGSSYGSLEISANDIDIQGILTGNAAGFTASNGTGQGTDGSTNNGAGGGSHGGKGGTGESGFASGSIYGDVLVPATMGSGGGNNSYSGGAGGAFVKLVSSNSFALSGSINVNGGTGGGASSNAAGGGAGGGVYISANTLSGSGNITANGGAGGNAGSAEGGGGGGGRIAYYYATSSFNGSISASGGLGPDTGLDGAAGTIYERDTDNTYGNLTIDNGAFAQDTATQLPTGTYTFDNISFKNTSRFDVQDGVTITSNNYFTINGNIYLSNTSSTGTITYPANWDLTLTTGSNTLVGNYTKWPIRDITLNGGTLSMYGVHNLRNVTIANGTTLSHPANSSAQTYDLQLNVSGDMTIDGSIDLDGLGYASTTGTGQGSDGANASGGGGGGYGGKGGNGEAGVSGGAMYGDVTNPIFIGSGGGLGESNAGGAGGGYVKLVVDGTLTVNGTISTDGTLGGDNNGSSAAGGGSGGSVNIITNTFAGSGTITANGGDGGDGASADGGGGGGGRIAYNYTTKTFNGSILARGGDGPGSYDGASGTIYEKASSPTYGNLTLDNSSYALDTPTQLPTGSYTFDYIYFRNNARFDVQDAVTITTPNSLNITGNFYFSNTSSTGTFTYPTWDISITTGTSYIVGSASKWPIRDISVTGGTLSLNGSLSAEDVTIGASGTLKHLANTTTQAYDLQLTVSGNMTVDGTINLDGLGYTATSGTGQGSDGANSSGGGGAGHAATGGNGEAGVSGGTSYGSAYNPVTIGSGGGNGESNSGGLGGGYVKLVVSGTLDIDGTISTNGTLGGDNNGSSAAGGGSGGSVNINTNLLSGSGTVRANGGDGGDGASAEGGGGAGGYIFISTPRSLFTGTLTANGGVGPAAATDGGTGSTILQINSLSGYWKLNEGIGSTANDGSIYNNPGTLTNSPTWVDGKFGRALSFNGLNDYISVPDSSSLSPRVGLSISAWVKRNTINTADGIVGKYVSSSNRQSYLLGMNTTYPTFMLSGSGTGSTSVTGTTSIAASQWYHIVGTWDLSTMKIYVNGKQENSTPFTSTLYDSTDPLLIGDGDAGSWYFDGTLDEIKVYNYGLSAAEVRAEYNQGAAVLGSKSTESGSTTPSSSNSRKYCVPGDSTSCNPPVAEWEMEDSSGTTVNDTSGNANTGTIVSTPQWIKAKDGKGIEFDGTTNYISVNDSATLKDFTGVTMSAWVYPQDFSTTAGGTYQRIMAKETDNNGLGGFLWGISNTGTLRYRAQGSNIDALGYSLTLNKWNYVAITVSDSETRTFMNGQQIDKAFGNFLPESGTSPLYIGQSSGSGVNRYFKGRVDKIRIYNYVRTPAQIAWDFNQGAPIGWYKMNECTGTTIYNGAPTATNLPAGYNGTLNLGSNGITSAGTCTGSSGTSWKDGASGKNGASIKFDGSDDNVMITDPANDLYDPDITRFSLTAWAKITPNTTGGIVVKGVWAGTSSGFYLYTRSGGGYPFAWWNGSTAIDIGANNGQWHHIAVVRSSTASNQLKLYFDGKLANTGTEARTLSTTANLYIGSASDGGYTNGQIDDVRIYAYDLTETQVKQIMNDGAVNFR